MNVAAVLRSTWVALFLALCALVAPLSAADAPATLSGKILILAAASTTDVIDLLRTDFNGRHPQVNLSVSYGASSALAKQIEGGADADLFLSASSQWSQYLDKQRLVAKQQDLFGNQLVVITPAASKLEIKQPSDLTNEAIKHLALADPAAVPAGVYAKQALTKLELWDKLSARVTGAADVRQALREVESGAAEAGIVYATDAAATNKVKVVLKLDEKLTDPIRYPLVLTQRGAKNPAAVAFYEFLKSPEAIAVYTRHGFLPVKGATP